MRLGYRLVITVTLLSLLLTLAPVLTIAMVKVAHTLSVTTGQSMFDPGALPATDNVTPPQSRPPTCAIQLREHSTTNQIGQVAVGRQFDIYIGGSTGNITEVWFGSDDNQDGNPTCQWSGPYNWGSSSGDWNGTDKIMKWTFTTDGDKEVWGRVVGPGGESSGHADILAGGLRGIDVSDNQGKIDWGQVADWTDDGGNQIQFAFVKATEGAPNTVRKNVPKGTKLTLVSSDEVLADYLDYNGDGIKEALYWSHVKFSDKDYWCAKKDLDIDSVGSVTTNQVTPLRTVPGITEEDDSFTYNMDQLARSISGKIVFGAYHYARPKLSPADLILEAEGKPLSQTREDSLKQEAIGEACHFVAVARPYLTTGYLRPALDLEENTGLDQEELSLWVVEWMNTVKTETGVTPILYTGPDFANNNLDGKDYDLASYNLWLAEWTGGMYLDANAPLPSQPTLPNIWANAKWDFWQYGIANSGGISGIGGTVDMDYFPGNSTSLKMFEIKEWLAPPAMYIDIACPVDLVVTDPEGLTISKDINEIQQGSSYIEADLNGDGDPDALVYIPDVKPGAYKMTVTPKPGADPTDTYSLEVSMGGSSIVLAQDVPIGEIPGQPYAVESTQSGIMAMPIASTGGPYTGNEGSSITLDASGSHDPDGTIVSYEWDFDGDGVFEVSSSSPSVQHTWSDNFTGVVTLRVTDNDGLTSTDTGQVTVSNVPPAVNAGPDQATYGVLSVAFSGSFTDPGVDTHTIAWDFGDGATATGTLMPTHVYASGGVYTVTLTVTDDDGGVGTDSLIVNTLQNDMGTGGDAYNTANTTYGSENATVLTQTASGAGFIWYKTASGPDRYDEYKIPVNYRDAVTITFTPPVGSTGVDLLIFGADKYILLTVSNITTQTTRQVTACCNGYIYFMIKADNTSDVGTYGVTVSVTSNPDNDMGTGGDAFNTGNTNYGNENATLLTQTASGTGFIWYRNSTGPDYCDEYKVPVSAGQVVTITFTPPAGSTGIDLLFFGTNKAKVKTIANVTSQVTQQITAAANGYICIMIKADTVSDVGIYSLSVSAS